MKEKRTLATKEFYAEVSLKADKYGGGAPTQSLLNYLKKHGKDMMDLEKENIKMAFEAGMHIRFESIKGPLPSSEWYYSANYEPD